MRVTLEVRSGLLIGRRFDVVPGPGTVFGRSEQASGFIPHDPEIGDFHFMVQWVEGEPQLKVLVQAPTTVNGEAVKETVLAQGDRVLAGRTSFEVKDLTVGAGSATPVAAAARAPSAAPSVAPAAASSATASAPSRPADEALTGREFLKDIGGIDDEALEVALPGQAAQELFDAFYALEDWPSALRIRAHLLGPRASVLWGLLALDHIFGETVPEEERAAYQAARAWVADPTEDNRRKAEPLGPEDEEGEGHAWLLCCGAFWSEGSLSLPGLPDVPTDPKFSGVAVAGMLRLAAYYEDPALAEERFPHFLELGVAVGRGEHPFPPPGRD